MRFAKLSMFFITLPLLFQCFTAYTVDSKFCRFKYKCSSKCHLEPWLLFADETTQIPVLSFSPRPGNREVGLALGVPPCIPFFPWPIYSGVHSSVTLTAQAGTPEDPVAKIRITGLDNGEQSGIYSFSGRPPLYLRPAIHDQPHEQELSNMVTVPLVHGYLNIESIKITLVSGRTFIISPLRLTTDNEYGFSIALEYDVSDMERETTFQMKPDCLQ